MSVPGEGVRAGPPGRLSAPLARRLACRTADGSVRSRLPVSAVPRLPIVVGGAESYLNRLQLTSVYRIASLLYHVNNYSQLQTVQNVQNFQFVRRDVPKLHAKLARRRARMLRPPYHLRTPGRSGSTGGRPSYPTVHPFRS